jgi:hypothetical protein
MFLPVRPGIRRKNEIMYYGFRDSYDGIKNYLNARRKDCGMMVWCCLQAMTGQSMVVAYSLLRDYSNNTMKKQILATAVIITLGGVLLFAGLSKNDGAASLSHTLAIIDEKSGATSSTEAQAEEKTAAEAPVDDAVLQTNARTITESGEQQKEVLHNSVTLGEVEEGNIITVSAATFLKPGYVALYRVNSNGDSALVGNSQLLSIGTHKNISVQLKNPAVKRQALVAVLHEDDGDGKFEFPGSDLYLRNGGLLINDIDVIGVNRTNREARILETQVKAYLETNFTKDN